MVKLIEKSSLKQEEKHNASPSNLIWGLLKIGTYLQREGNRIVGEYSIKQQHFTVLNEIVRRGPVNQKQILGELLFEKSNVSKIVQALAKKELIEVNYSRADRRNTILTHTTKGLKIWQLCMDQFNQWGVLFTSSFNQEEIRQLAKLLEKLPIMKK